MINELNCPRPIKIKLPIIQVMIAKKLKPPSCWSFYFDREITLIRKSQIGSGNEQFL